MSAQKARTDIQPVILGGDMASYPLAREFHEAFGTTSICVVPEPLKIIEKSRFIKLHRVSNLGAQSILDAVTQIAEENAGKTIILMANSDAAVAAVESVHDSMPANVICSLPPHDVMEQASDKVNFAAMCEHYGLDAPHSEVVSLAGTDAIAPTAIPFPLIAKPTASSADYTRLYAKGFKKIYFIKEQAELDQLWADLRAEGFTGSFLVQELIMGDDTYVDMITAYVNQEGELTMFSSAQVLLEDHAPTLFGNPVAMITRPMPELWEKVGRMLKGIGWRGFANFDMKRDPATGRVIFMDFNPRIGCNSYYACAGGINPMKVLVDDLVDHRSELTVINRVALYTRGPASLVRKYIKDPELLAEFDDIVKRGEVYNPMRYSREGSQSRLLGYLMTENYIRKFAKYYPEVTDTAF